MGKKSRKPKGAAGAASRKEQLQERRERTLEVAANPELYDDEYDDEEETKDRPYLPGDRVWFGSRKSDGNNPLTYRGIVESTGYTLAASVGNPKVVIVPLQKKIDGIDEKWAIDAVDVFPDLSDLTLRFDVGEHVLCYYQDRWVPRTVTNQWPIYVLEESNSFASIRGPHDVVPQYKCGTVAVPFDNDSCIMKHPASFRFAIGDAVIFNSELAFATGKSLAELRASATFCNGVVTQIDITGRSDAYCSYECSFGAKGKLKCHISKDDDEHIARISSEPRERLFEAIEQDCSCQHLSYLATFYSIEISIIRDLVLDKAIEYGSYNTILWLQEEHDLDVDSIIDASKNTLLHQIAKSSHVTRFIEQFASQDPNESHLQFNKSYSRERIFDATNSEGQTWLEILVEKRNIRALDVALSFHRKFAWSMRYSMYYSSEKMDSLKHCVERKGDHSMQLIFDTFERNMMMIKTYDKRWNNDRLMSLMSVFVHNEDAMVNAARFVRFVHDWNGTNDVSLNFFGQVVQNGLLRLFEVFYEADNSWFWNGKANTGPNDDDNEYIQPQLSSTNEIVTFQADIITICIVGKTEYKGGSKDLHTKSRYFRTVRQYCCSYQLVDCRSFGKFLKKKAEIEKENGYSDGYYDLLVYKASLFEDNESLPGRIAILSYIVRDRPQTKLDVLLAIRHRQCGILRWMAEKKIIDLATDAKTAGLVRTSFRFIKKVPSMHLGHFLCFVAVEYDDLYSLQWLCETIGHPNKICEGMNILHLASLLGRFEIIGWLRTTTGWEMLCDKACTYRELDGTYPAHIAAAQGHIEAAEMLLKFGCKEYDARGKPPEFYAKNSPILSAVSFERSYQFAHDWAKERSNEASLEPDHEKNVKKLLNLLEKRRSLHMIKDHIICTKCLDIDLWQNANYQRYDHVGSNGLSYGDVIKRCMAFSDERFPEWLTMYLKKLGDFAHIHDVFWKEQDSLSARQLHQKQLLSWAKANGKDTIIEALSCRLVKDISIDDPAVESIFNLAAQSNSMPDRLKSKMIEVRAILKIMERIIYRLLSDAVVYGCKPAELEELATMYQNLRHSLEMEGWLNAELTDRIYTLKAVAERRNLLEIDRKIRITNQAESPLRHILYFRNVSLCQIGHVIVVEAHIELVEFFLKNGRGWTRKVEIEMILAASFLGHTEIVSLLLDDNAGKFCTTRQERCYGAMIGACASGRKSDLQVMMMNSGDVLPEDPIRAYSRNDGSTDAEKDDNSTTDTSASILKESLIGSAIYSYIMGVHSDLTVVSFLVNNLKYSSTDTIFSLVHSLTVLQYYPNAADRILRAIDVFRFLSNEFRLEPVSHVKPIKMMMNVVKECAERTHDKTGEEPQNVLSTICEWFESLIVQVDLQSLEIDLCRNELYNMFSKTKEKQREYWAQFDVIKKGHSLADVQQAVQNEQLNIDGYDRGGLQLIHLAASYDRLDVLQWLVIEKGLDLEARDGRNRNVQRVAEASRALSTASWIRKYNASKTISSFISLNLQRIQAFQKHRKIKRSVTLIQRAIRGYNTRKIYSEALFKRLEGSQRFNAIWEATLRLLRDQRQDIYGWEAVRAQTRDISRGDIDRDTIEKLNDALSKTVLEDDKDDIILDDQTYLHSTEESTSLGGPYHQQANDTKWANMFQVTSHVVKFLKSGDPLYRSFFVRRMQQLASGDRSRILQKRLKGSESTIYETYLEQKSGFRILWTEEGDTIVVWFVAKHKSVSRLMRLIDDAKSRSARQKMPESLLNDGSEAPAENILLDVSNAPLKIYDLSFHELDDVTKASWTPQLHLTDEERQVVEADGTVLLLGRSGTGKTVCICNRMEMDRQRFQHDPTFSQLFVSRSSRLCKYVKEVVVGAESESGSQSFLTFRELLYQLETSVPRSDKGMTFTPSARVDYYRFERDFYRELGSSKNLSALLVWKTIQTFLKGSIEAFQSPHAILDKEYFVSGALGKNRCRLDPGLGLGLGLGLDDGPQKLF